MLKYFLGLLLLLGTIYGKDYDFTYRNWRSTVTDLVPGGYDEGIEIAMNDLGKVVVVWENDETDQVQAVYSTDRGQTWSTARTISVESGFVPQVAINNSNQAVIVFENTTTATIQASYSQDGGATWSTPESISTAVAGQTMNGQQVALNASGQAVAVWDRLISGSYKIQASYSADGGATWTSEVDVSTAGQSSHTPEVALNASGRQLVIWNNATAKDLEVSFSINNGTTWSTPEGLLVGKFSGYHVGLNASGQALVVWKNTSVPRIESRFSADGGATWPGTQVSISAAGEVATAPETALNDAGQAIAVWQNTTSSRVQAASSTDGGATWATPIIFSATGGNAKEPDVALNAAGQATAVWGRNNGSNYIGQANYSTDGGATWLSNTSMINF